MGNFNSRNNASNANDIKQTWQSRVRQKKNVRQEKEFKDSGIDLGYEGDTEKPSPGEKNQQEHELNMLQEHHQQQVEETNLKLFERFSSTSTNSSSDAELSR